jgi:membrane-associated protease RseP (regulator of RpoE activity)
VFFSAIGIKLSTFTVGVTEEVGTTIKLGVPPLYELLQHLFSTAPGGGEALYATYWHPFAFSGWLGMLVTALNLLPVGQLDGGHIIFTIVSRKWHRRISWGIIITLVFLGIGTKPFFDMSGLLSGEGLPSSLVKPYVFSGWNGWLVWALILTFISRRHPPILSDEAPIDRPRKFMALLAFALLILCFTPFPIAL